MNVNTEFVKNNALTFRHPIIFLNCIPLAVLSCEPNAYTYPYHSLWIQSHWARVCSHQLQILPRSMGQHRGNLHILDRSILEHLLLPRCQPRLQHDPSRYLSKPLINHWYFPHKASDIVRGDGSGPHAPLSPQGSFFPSSLFSVGDHGDGLYNHRHGYEILEWILCSS